MKMLIKSNSYDKYYIMKVNSKKSVFPKTQDITIENTKLFCLPIVLGGAFLPNFQTKLKFYKINIYIYIYWHKYTLWTYKTPYIVWNPTNLPVVGAQNKTCYSFRNSESNDRLKILVTRCQCLGGSFLPNFQTKLKFYKIYIYSLKLNGLCINKQFRHAKRPYAVLNPFKLACCGSPK